MAFPDIFPVEPGRDGWKPVFDTAAARLLYHCNLLPTGMRVKAGKPSTIDWVVAKAVPAWQKSEELRPLKPTIESLQRVLRKVADRHGTAEVRDILRVHGNCRTLLALKASNYSGVYVAATVALGDPPRVK